MTIGVHVVVVSAGLALATCGPAARGQEAPAVPVDAPAATVASGSASGPAPVDLRWLSQEVRARLEALTPASPEAYLVLGEDVLDAADTPQEQRLARELVTLAFVLGWAQEPGAGVASSAALVLATLAGPGWEQGALRALAEGEGVAARADAPSAESPGRQPGGVGGPGRQVNTQSVAYQTAVAFGLARAGLGVQARQVLRRSEVQQRLAALEPTIAVLGVPDARTLWSTARAWPCSQCQNDGFVRRRANEFRICPTCNGLPGERTPSKALLAQVRLELWLLRELPAVGPGPGGGWGTQRIIDQGEPLRIIDPSLPARLFLVDPARPYWREGRWWPTPEGRDAPAPTPEAAPEQPLEAPAGSSSSSSGA